MHLPKQLNSEREYWEALEAIGTSVRSSIGPHLPTTPQDKESISHTKEAHALARELLRELHMRFQIVPPGLNGAPGVREERERAEPPSGYRYFWDWYRDMEEFIYRERYEEIICSACPFSDGLTAFLRLGGAVPCGRWPGMLFRLVAPHLCGMVTGGEWDHKFLHQMILDYAGPRAERVFSTKEDKLIDRSGEPPT